MLKVFIGYDPREAIAYHVCVNSIIRHASKPVAITPLALGNLKGVYDEQHTDGSNAFIYSRFLVPYLCGFKGLALYLDGDMLVKGDVCELFDLAANQIGKDVLVVKHDYVTRSATKYLGNRNENYPRKNWSSVILWNCGNYPNHILTPTYVAEQTGAHLHRFQWLNDGRIGDLPRQWNHLVGEYPHDNDAKLLHYTLGIPAFSAYEDCDHCVEWFDELHKVTSVEE